MNPLLPGSNLLIPIAVLVPIVLALPPSRTILEAGLVGHMLVQLPLLGAAGFAAGIVTRRHMRRQLLWWDRGGITGLVTFLFISLF